MEEVRLRVLDRLGVACFRALYGLVFCFLAVPVLVIAATSLSPSAPASFPPEAVSARWYVGFVTDPEWSSALRNSLFVSCAVGILAALLGATAAYGLNSLEKRWKKSVLAVAVLPLATPLIVVAVSLVVLLGRFDAVGSYTAVVAGHTVITAPLGLLITYGALTRVDWSVRESALDLGAGRIRAFREATLPQLRSAVFASVFLAAVLSMHEFLVSLFITDFTTRTVPVLTWINLRNRLDPTASVVSTLLVVAAVLCVGVALITVGIDRLAREL